MSCLDESGFKDNKHPATVFFLLFSPASVVDHSQLTFAQAVTMSGYQGHNEYDAGYGQHPQQGNTDSYYQDEHQYHDNNAGYDQHAPNAQGAPGGQQGDGYYDEQ